MPVDMSCVFAAASKKLQMMYTLDEFSGTMIQTQDDYTFCGESINELEAQATLQ